MTPPRVTSPADDTSSASTAPTATSSTAGNAVSKATAASATATAAAATKKMISLKASSVTPERVVAKVASPKSSAMQRLGAPVSDGKNGQLAFVGDNFFVEIVRFSSSLCGFA